LQFEAELNLSAQSSGVHEQPKCVGHGTSSILSLTKMYGKFTDRFGCTSVPETLGNYPCPQFSVSLFSNCSEVVPVYIA